MRVGYFVNQYPKVSHSFIRREILAVEEQGIEIERYALRGWDADLVDAADLRERDRTHYLLRDGVAGLVAPTLTLAVSAPGRFLAGLAVAWKQWRAGDRTILINLVTLAEACRLAQWLKRDAVDHLHAHFGTNSAVVAMMVKAVSGIGYSLTIHGSEEWDSPRQLRMGEKVRQSRFVAAISQFTRAQLMRWSGRAAADRIHVVHCGLDRREVVAAVPIEEGNRRFVCVGRLCPEKAQTLLVEAMARLSAEGESFDLVLAGDGETRGEIESMLARAGIANRVRITGWIDNNEVQRELSVARAFILTSLVEGLPVVIMEAMAAGRPVLSTSVAGIPELVENGQEGWLFPPGSVDAIVEAMRACLATPVAELNRMGERGRRKVWGNHAIEVEAARLAKLFRESQA